mmetsp:Transcript_36448/g.60929  ORF Transcript_36448/g.60929 Transcript_36448/m.60929 type:complete len:235 (+) Transcript_36448:326-1030(+)
MLLSEVQGTPRPPFHAYFWTPILLVCSLPKAKAPFCTGCESQTRWAACVVRTADPPFWRGFWPCKKSLFYPPKCPPKIFWLRNHQRPRTESPSWRGIGHRADKIALVVLVQVDGAVLPVLCGCPSGSPFASPLAHWAGLTLSSGAPPTVASGTNMLQHDANGSIQLVQWLSGQCRCIEDASIRLLTNDAGFHLAMPWGKRGCRRQFARISPALAQTLGQTHPLHPANIPDCVAL